jgi:hypothetical protein
VLTGYLMNGTQVQSAAVLGTIDGMIAGYLMNGFQIMSGQLVGAVGNDLSNCYGQGSALAQASGSQ